MNFLDNFTLEDVATVFIGLLIVSIVRIWYESYVNKKKATQFGSSLGLYNSLLEDTKEGLLIITDTDNIIYVNDEAADVLHTQKNRIDKVFLSTFTIENVDRNSQDTLLNIIHTQSYLSTAYTKSSPVSISINKVLPNENSHAWYVVILQNITHIEELRDGAKDLLQAA